MSTAADVMARRPQGIPAAAPARPAGPRVLQSWLRDQVLNLRRHAAALRPFRHGEFGTGIAAPSEGHLQAANGLIRGLRKQLLEQTESVDRAVQAALLHATTERLQEAVRQKERGHDWVRAVEKLWDYYFELFGQREAKPFGEWLLGCDRIALDCYQVAFMGVGKAKSVPAPPPFSYMRTGFSPATYRRGVPLQRLGHQLNPFPLIELPYHRLVNPWTLGAILHELSHNLQSDLGLNKAIPKGVARTLLTAGLPPSVVEVWVRWNRETFADLSALLLGGPAVVGSLMDVVGRSPETAFAFSPRAPHPTPYLRAFLSLELLRRIGFEQQAREYRRAWTKIYPRAEGGVIPEGMLRTFATACPLVVDAMCYRPYRALGGRSLAKVMCFQAKNQALIEEAARRLAAGTDPGIIPERFLIGAARFALEHHLARPGVIHKNFFSELARR